MPGTRLNLVLIAMLTLCFTACGGGGGGGDDDDGDALIVVTITPPADTDIEVGESITLTATGSSNIGTSIISYDWDFGDGGEATGEEVSHIFTTEGTYTVTVEITDDSGNTTTTTITIVVGDPDNPDDPDDPDNPGSSVGTPVSSALDETSGSVLISYPDATTGLTITAVSANDGKLVFADVDPAPEATDGIRVFFPQEGSYDVVVTVGGTAQAALTVTVASSSDFIISGDVRDGTIGSEVGVDTDVELYWQAATDAARVLVQTVQSVPNAGQADDGAYSFEGLIGPVGNFEVVVKGGTN